MLRRLSLILTTVSTVLCSSLVLATEDIYIPESLEPWVDWVLEEHPHVSCPVRATDGVRLNCIWVRETNINVMRGTTFGATFELKVHAFAESMLQLPYSESFKPQNFTLDGQELALGGGNNAPEVLVPEGSHTLKGELIWTEESEPRFLDIPRSGIVRLAIDGQPVEHPSLQAGGGRLWFSNEISTPPKSVNTPDSEIVRVFRHFTDDVPQTLTTHIQVTITGNARTLEFGQVISDEYEITHLKSQWPAILSNEGNLAVQVTPGSNEIQIDARAITQLNSFRYHKASQLWPDVEYWGIQPRHDLRIIRMEGAQRTDLSQINAPWGMRDLSGFVLVADDELNIIEEQRGSSEPYTSSFAMSRGIWLNFRGNSYTVVDSIRADVATSERVTSSIPLGTVRINGVPRMISYDDSSGEQMSSIYLRPEDSHLTAVSKISREQSLAANTWSVEANNLIARLNIPPGWLFLWSHGIDNVEYSWLSKWGIWDIFIVLLLLCLVWGLGGWKWTAVVAGAVLISYQFDHAPTIGWIILAGTMYAVKAIKQSTLSKVANISFWVVFVVVASACFFHATISARNALHPQLAANDTTFNNEAVRTLSRILPGKPGSGAARIVSFTQQSQPQASLSRSRSGTENEMEEVITTGSRMPIEDPTFIADGYTVEDIEAMGTSDLADFFRSLPSQFNSTLSSLPVEVQTGPGIPTWMWQRTTLSWDGPVAQDRKMQLVLLPPWFTRLIYGLSAISTLLVLGYFLNLKAPEVKNCIKRTLPGIPGIASLILLGVFLNPQDTHADIPDENLLEELEKRLLALPDCLPECAYLEEARVTLSDGALSIAMQIHAEDRVAIPLPSENGTWNLVDVRRGANQLPILRERSRLYTLLDDGVHDIVISANITGLDQLDIEFDLIPGHLEIVAPDWRVEGLVHGQVGDRKLTFSRVNTIGNGDTSTAPPSITQSIPSQLEITPYVAVVRQINLTYEPTVITRVTRVAPYTGELTVRIPLLPEELVSTSGLLVEDTHMVVNLKSSAQTFLWESKLNLGPTLTLTAPSIAERSERWSIQGSDFWSFNHDGIVPIDTGDNHTTFIPLSNEVLQVELQQQTPVPGKSITVERITTSHSVNDQTTTTQLNLNILASQPGDLSLTLPDDASIEGFVFAGVFQALPSSNKVLLPVQSGRHTYSLDWETNNGASILYKPDTVSLSQSAINAKTSIRFTDNRWILWLAGSSLGGTVAFWSILIGVLFAAIAFSKIPGVVLTTRDAVILAVGATLVNLSLLVYVGIWFLAIWLKSRVPDEVSRRWLYQVGQILLCVVTFAAVITVIFAIPSALTNDPNMYVMGYQATADYFVWFSDEITESLTTPWVLSLPKWTYSVLILLWAMWLVFALLKWLRIWWQTLKTPVLWASGESVGVFAKFFKTGREPSPSTEKITNTQ